MPPPRGFTMVELIVVVTILLILIGLVISVSSRAIDSGKQRQAKAILDILDTAIEQFATDNPLASWSSASGPLVGLGLNPIFYKRDFGAFPPHYDWYAETDPQADGIREWTLAKHPVNQWNASRTNLLYPGVQFWLMGGVSPVQDDDLRRHAEEFNDPNAVNEKRYDLENSENLYFFLTQLSPEAKVILDRLPSGTLTNTDTYARKGGSPPVVAQPDAVELTPGEPNTRRDLMEFRDPWGNVISYWVYFFQEDPDVRPDGVYVPNTKDRLIQPRPVLESAGPDGKFGHRPGIGHFHDNPDPLDDDKALPDNLFSRPPPWKE